MTREALASALARGPRWAAALALALAFAGAVALVSGFGSVAGMLSSGITLLVCGAIAGGLVAGAIGALLRTGSRRVRAGLALLRAGGAAVVIAAPASLAWREAAVFQVGEGDVPGEAAPPELAYARFENIDVSPQGSAVLLSKRVEVTVTPGAAPPRRVGLWPPTRVAGWDLTIVRYGFAADVDWRADDGSSRVTGFVMLGTFPKTEEEARLVEWTPEPNLMMGVGFYPPKLEDLVSTPDRRGRIFIRLDAATLGGTRRDLRDAESWRWLADGAPRDPEYHVEVFRGRRRVYEGRIRGGDHAAFEGGRVALGNEVVLWLEVQAVRDPFVGAALLGMISMIAGGALLLRTRRARATGPAGGGMS